MEKRTLWKSCEVVICCDLSKSFLNFQASYLILSLILSFSYVSDSFLLASWASAHLGTSLWSFTRSGSRSNRAWWTSTARSWRTTSANVCELLKSVCRICWQIRPWKAVPTQFKLSKMAPLWDLNSARIVSSYEGKLKGEKGKGELNRGERVTERVTERVQRNRRFSFCQVSRTSLWTSCHRCWRTPVPSWRTKRYPAYSVHVCLHFQAKLTGRCTLATQALTWDSPETHPERKIKKLKEINEIKLKKYRKYEKMRKRFQDREKTRETSERSQSL